MITQGLIIDETYTLKQLQQLVSQGGKFVTFRYCWSFFLVTFTYLSPPVFIPDEIAYKKYIRRYNLISGVFGWWGFPIGPFRTWSCIQFNKRGGLDVTNDIMLNITEEGLKVREVEILSVADIFDKPDKAELKAFQKSLLKNFEMDFQVKQIVVALDINIEEEVIRPMYVVGLRVNNDFDKYVEEFRSAFLFYKSGLRRRRE